MLSWDISLLLKDRQHVCFSLIIIFFANREEKVIALASFFRQRGKIDRPTGKLQTYSHPDCSSQPCICVTSSLGFTVLCHLSHLLFLLKYVGQYVVSFDWQTGTKLAQRLSRCRLQTLSCSRSVSQQWTLSEIDEKQTRTGSLAWLKCTSPDRSAESNSSLY